MKWNAMNCEQITNIGTFICDDFVFIFFDTVLCSQFWPIQMQTFVG